MIARARWASLLAVAVAAALPTEGATAAAELATVPYQGQSLLDLRQQLPVDGNAQAGSEHAAQCAGCHGPSGISLVPTYPNIAGQRAAYAFWQLLAYKARNEPDNPMTPVLQPLDEQDLRDLAAYYAGLDPDPPALVEPEPIDPDEATRGAELFARGDAQRGIVGCQGCHGEDARGRAQLPASWPRLRGQSPGWTAIKLTRYRAGEDIDSTQDLIMQSVAQRLEDADIAALSAYLGSLPRD